MHAHELPLTFSLHNNVDDKLNLATIISLFRHLDYFIFHLYSIQMAKVDLNRMPKAKKKNEQHHISSMELQAVIRSIQSKFLILLTTSEHFQLEVY